MRGRGGPDGSGGTGSSIFLNGPITIKDSVQNGTASVGRFKREPTLKFPMTLGLKHKLGRLGF